MTQEMARVLAEAKEHGDWFSISHHDMSPVRARHQTVKALYNRGYLDRLAAPIYRADMPIVVGYNILYRYSPRMIFQEGDTRGLVDANKVETLASSLDD